jgi:hypothetical protein
MEFRSYRSYQEFAVSVTRRWRYVRLPEESSFIETVLATSAGKEEALPVGSMLWRSRIGHDYKPEEVGEGLTEDFPTPFSPDKMKPAKDRTIEGRINSKGIPCLYTATHEQTAILEQRPWVGALVSVAQLRTTRELQIMNCTVDDRSAKIYFGEPDQEERSRAVWRDIDRAFAEPVDRSDDTASYAPTQVLAEFFRKKGFDGVAYRSAFGPGHNVALFDLEVAEVISCSLVEIRKVTLSWGPAANPYFIPKKDDTALETKSGKGAKQEPQQDGASSG